MVDNTQIAGGSGDTIRDIDRSGVKTQVIQLDAGGQSSESLVSLTNPLPSAQSATNFIFSANGVNSSITQLAKGASFIGAIEAILSQVAISVLVTIDQPAVLMINQFVDAGGARLSSTNSYMLSGAAPFSQSIVANGNYCQVTLQNLGGATTTTLNLNTAYGTLPPTTQLGNIANAITEVGGVAIVYGGSLPVNVTANVAQVAIDQYRSVRDVLLYQSLLNQQASMTYGFIPMETPSFLVGG